VGGGWGRRGRCVSDDDVCHRKGKDKRNGKKRNSVALSPAEIARGEHKKVGGKEGGMKMKCCFRRTLCRGREKKKKGGGIVKRREVGVSDPVNLLYRQRKRKKKKSEREGKATRVRYNLSARKKGKAEGGGKRFRGKREEDLSRF